MSLRVSRTWPYLVLFAVFAVGFWDVLSAPFVLQGIDFNMPIVNPWIPLSQLYSGWSPWVLGSPYGVSIVGNIYQAILQSIFSLLSFGTGPVVAQKLFFLGIYVGGVSMYILLSHLLRDGDKLDQMGMVSPGEKYVPYALLGSLMYMFSPIVLYNYGTGLIWEFGLLPLSVYLVFKVVHDLKVKYALLLPCVMAVQVGFGNHVLLALPLTALFMTFWRLRYNPRIVTQVGKARHLAWGKTQYLKKVFSLWLLASALFIVLDHPLIPSLFNMGRISGTESAEGLILAFQANYGANRLPLWNALLDIIVFKPSWSYASWLGYGLAGFAFLSTPFIRNPKMKTLAYSLLFTLGIFLVIATLANLKSPLLTQLYHIFPPIAFSHDRMIAITTAWLTTTTLTTIGLHRIVDSSRGRS